MVCGAQLLIGFGLAHRIEGSYFGRALVGGLSLGLESDVACSLCLQLAAGGSHRPESADCLKAIQQRVDGSPLRNLLGSLV